MREALQGLASLGWIESASPLQAWPDLGRQLGLAKLWIKRDDQIPALGGGNKVRKLDLMLADPLYRDSLRWHTMGSLGSGHLLASARAATKLGHRLIAHVCDQPLSAEVLDTLARTSTEAAKLLYYPSRAALALQQPQLFLARRWRGEAIISPGGSSPAGCAGFVLAAFELCEQLTARDEPMPDRIYLPFGSGGAAVGLAVGLALAGASSTVVAVSTVERLLIPPGRIASLSRSLLSWLRSRGLPVPRHLHLRLRLERAQVGGGYAQPTPASRSAVTRLGKEGLHLEPVYSGKAMAAMIADAERCPGQRWLFWLTCHGQSQQEIPQGWRAKLPPALQERLRGFAAPS